jgi:hypothetical protein
MKIKLEKDLISVGIDIPDHKVFYHYWKRCSGNRPSWLAYRCLAKNYKTGGVKMKDVKKAISLKDLSDLFQWLTEPV